MLSHPEAFYTQTLLHRHFYPQKILHTEAFTHRCFYAQKLLHTEAFTHRSFYTQKLLRTEAFTHRSFLHADAFAHRSFYTDAFTQKLLRTEAFTHRSFYTQKLILPQFLAIEPHFVRKDCVSRRLVGTAPRLKREVEKKEKEEGKRARGQESKRAREIGCEDVRMWRCEDVKMWRWEDVKMRRSFFILLKRFSSYRRHILHRSIYFFHECSRKFKVKMRRCEDVRMWGCEDVKMRRCEDVRMWRCEDVRMWRWEDVKMRRCEDEKMWRWADVKMRRWKDVKMWRCEDVWTRRYEDLMWRCEDVKMFDRPPLLEEPFAQKLSGKTTRIEHKVNQWKQEKLKKGEHRVLQKNSHPPTCGHITPDPPAPTWSMLLPNACRHPNRNGCFFWRPFQAKRCNNIELGEGGHASFFAMSLTWWLFFLKNLDNTWKPRSAYRH